MVEGARLEIVWARKRLGGSNPLASARKFLKMTPCGLFFEDFSVGGGVEPRVCAEHKEFLIVYRRI